MSNQSTVAPAALRKRTALQQFIINFKKNWQLHLMMLLPLAYILIFEYIPMYGLQMAFRDFRTGDGHTITSAPWVGLEQFKLFFDNIAWTRIVSNTLRISIYSMVASFPVPIILALILHVNERKVLKKVTQNVSYVPHFISTVVMVGILNQIFNPFNGLFAALYQYTGISFFQFDLMNDATIFDHVYVWSGVWQSMGWSAIMYVAALSAVPMELHEAAKIDGASRIRRIFAVDLPAIMPTIVILLILRCGSIMSVGGDKVLLMLNDLNGETAEVISTFVYNRGLVAADYSYAAAVDMFTNVVNMILLLTVNWISGKVSETSLF